VTTEQLEGDEALLGGAEFRHLRARRLGRGDEVVLTDGVGRERRAIVANVDRARAVLRLQPQTDARQSPESPLRLTLAQAALKTNKLDLVIEKATELGVTEIVIFTSTRCVAKPAGERLKRWERLARSAAKQCQRTRAPSIRGPVAFDQVLAQATQALALLFYESAGENDRLFSPQKDKPEAVLAMVGPEGGFTAEEVNSARAAGVRVAGLGPRILRAETAAIVAVTICQSAWGDLRLQ
jgi:16S rRNA (uracil1498-N3)-methyltransferase